MSNPEDMAIQGTTVMTYVDNMHMTLRQSVTRLPIFVIALSFGLICVPVIFSLIHPDSLAAQEPVRETVRFMGENWKIPIAAGLLYLIGIQVCSAFCFLRLPVAARTITYSADASGMRFSDGQGSSGHMPWMTVRNATRTTRYIILKAKIGPLRFIALRSFADPEKLWKLVATNVLGR